MRTDRIGFSAHTTLKVDRKPDLTPQPTLSPGDGYSAGSGLAEGVGEEAVGPVGYGTARGLSEATAIGSATITATGASGGLSDAYGAAGEVYMASASGSGDALAVGRSSHRAIALAGGVSTPVASSLARWESKGFSAGASSVSAVGSGSQTLLLQHFDAPPGSGIPADDRAGVVWQMIGSTASIQDWQKFGEGALYLPYYEGYGRAYGFTSPHAGSWTMEGWAYAQDGSSPPVISLILTWGGDGVTPFAKISVDTRPIPPFPYQRYLVLSAFDAGTIPIVQTSAVMSGFSFGVYYHFAMVRDHVAGTYSGYFNGSRLIHVSASTNIGSPTYFVTRDENIYLSGLAVIDEVRLSPNVRYSGESYTVPSAPSVID